MLSSGVRHQLFGLAPSPLDQPFEIRKMLRQRALAFRRQLVPSHGPAILKFFERSHVAGVLELPELCAEIPVGLVEQSLQATERQPVVTGQQHRSRDSRAVLKKVVQLDERELRGVVFSGSFQAHALAGCLRS